eukprot:jgi/Mesvir1/27295/Mv07128-RA.1
MVLPFLELLTFIKKRQGGHMSSEGDSESCSPGSASTSSCDSDITCKAIKAAETKLHDFFHSAASGQLDLSGSVRLGIVTSVVDLDARAKTSIASIKGIDYSGKVKDIEIALAKRAWRKVVPHMSWTALIFFTLFLLWNILCLALPMHYRNPASYKTPAFIRYFRQAHPGYESSLAAGRTYGVGQEATWPLMYTYAVALLPVSRTSPLLACVGVSYEETLRFHKFCGWLAFFWLFVHATFTTFPTFTIGLDRYVAQAWTPEIAVGEWVFAGQIACILQIIMVVFAFKYFRERFYWLFRATHCLYIPIFMASVAHKPVTFWYCHAVPDHQRNVQPEKTTIVHTRGAFPPGASAALKVPGRFFYVQIPRVSFLEWHPMSVVHADDEGNVTFGE